MGSDGREDTSGQSEWHYSEHLETAADGIVYALGFVPRGDVGCRATLAAALRVLVGPERAIAKLSEYGEDALSLALAQVKQA